MHGKIARSSNPADAPEFPIQEMVSTFFHRMLEKWYLHYPYKVVFSRGCFTLYKTVANHTQNVRDGTLMTDSGLLARAEELADYWKANGRFPNILLLDDMVYHGRALVSFLSALEKQLMPLFPGWTQEKIRRELAKTVRSEAVISCGTPALLYPEYHPGFHKFSDGKCNIREFRKCSQQLNDYLVNSDAVNAAYTISARLSNDSVSKSQIERYIDWLTENGYRRYRFRDGTAVLLKCFPNLQHPKAVFSIRILQGKPSYWIVPYIFTVDFDKREFRAQTRFLDDAFSVRFRGRALSEMEDSHRVQCELVSMMLNHLLLRHTLSGAGVSGYQLDWENATLNFGGDSYSRDFLRGFLEQAETKGDDCFQKWSYMLLKMEQDLALPAARPEEALDLGTTKELLEWYIYSWGSNAELVAHRYGTGELTLEMTSGGYKVNRISTFLQQFCALTSGRDWQWDARRMIACLLYYMDHGVLAVSMHAANENTGCRHYLRVSEASLALLPKRNRQYLPLLIFMESFCYWGWKRMEQKIEEYFGGYLKKTGLATELWFLVRCIHRSGQSLEDWCDWSPDQEMTDPYIQQYKQWRGWSDTDT